MVPAATRQDLQNALERAKNSIVSSMFSRQDAQTIIAQLRNAIARDLHELHAENEQTVRQNQAQREQLLIRMASIEHRLQVLQQTMTKFLEIQARYTNQYYR